MLQSMGSQRVRQRLSHWTTTTLASGPWFVVESSASLSTGAESNLRDRVLGEVEKDSFIALPGKVGKPGSCPQITCPNLGKIGRSFLVTFQRGHDQLVDILLMGWW